MVQIFCSCFRERASTRSPPGNHLYPTFFFRPGENPYDATIIFGLDSMRSSILGTRPRSGYTSELASRISPGPRISASGALALVKRVFFFVCVRFSHFFRFFCRLSVKNITHHMTKLYSSKDPKLKQHLTASFSRLLFLLFI